MTETDRGYPETIGLANEPDQHDDAKGTAELSDLRPPWIRSMQRIGFSLSSDFNRLWRACGKSGRIGLTTDVNRCNILNHRSRTIFAFKKRQTLVFDFTKPLRIMNKAPNSAGQLYTKLQHVVLDCVQERFS